MTPELLAQVSQTARFEKEQKSADNNYFVFPMGIDGIMTLRDKNKFIAGNKKVWELLWLDTELNEKWYTEMEIASKLDVVGFDAYQSSIFILLRESSNNKSPLELIKIGADLEIERFQIENEMRFDLSHFIIIKNSAILGGYVAQQPAIVLYDLGSEKPRILPGFFQKNSEIVDLRLNINGTFNIILFEQTTPDLKKLKLKTYDSKGNLLIEDEFDVNFQLRLQSGISSALIRDDMMLTGTFGNRVSKQSAGIFSTVVDPFVEHEIKYWHFNKLENFFNYMGEKKARKYKQKAERKNNRGKNFEFNTGIMPVSIFETTNGFVLYAEVFQQQQGTQPPPNYMMGPEYFNPYMVPSYRTNRRFYSPPYYGYPYNSTGQQNMSTEKRIYSSILVGFNEQADLKWDLSFPFKNLRKLEVDQVSDIIFTDERAIILFKQDKNIELREYYFGNKQLIEESIPISLKHPDEILKNENKEDGAIRYWYDNHMMVWGYQSIKGAGKAVDSESRNVFYINKLSID